MAETPCVESQLRALVEQAPGPMALFDRDMNLLAVSGPWHAGHAGAQMDGAGLPADTPDTWRDAFQHGLQGETVHGPAHRSLDADSGATRWTMQPWRDETGVVAGVVVMLSQGGHEPDLGADSLAAARERLRIQALVFRNAQEGIVITDERCEVIDANPAFERITEYPLAEIRGRHMRFIKSGRHDRHFYRSMWETLLATGRWQGEIWNRRKSGDLYVAWLSISAVRDESGRVTNFVGTSIDLTRGGFARGELEQRAYQDPLTGTPNRVFMMSRLKHAIDRAVRHRQQGAVLFLDLDGFRAVNEAYGHPVGDELLRQVADRLRGRLREIDTVARLAGDEFVVILEDVSGARSAATVAQALLEELVPPFPLVPATLTEIGASIGIALFPSDGDEPALLVQRADEALYLAKQGGRGTFRFF